VGRHSLQLVPVHLLQQGGGGSQGPCREPGSAKASALPCCWGCDTWASWYERGVPLLLLNLWQSRCWQMYIHEQMFNHKHKLQEQKWIQG